MSGPARGPRCSARTEPASPPWSKSYRGCCGRTGVGGVSRELPRNPDLTVMGNPLFTRQPLSPLGTVARRHMRPRADELFESIGLAGIKPARQVRDLSVAARQLVAI